MTGFEEVRREAETREGVFDYLRHLKENNPGIFNALIKILWLEGVLSICAITNDDSFSAGLLTKRIGVSLTSVFREDKYGMIGFRRFVDLPGVVAGPAKSKSIIDEMEDYLLGQARPSLKFKRFFK